MERITIYSPFLRLCLTAAFPPRSDRQRCCRAKNLAVAIVLAAVLIWLGILTAKEVHLFVSRDSEASDLPQGKLHGDHNNVSRDTSHFSECHQ